MALRSEELHPGAGSEREEQHGPLGFEGSLGCRAGGGSAGRDPAGPGAGRLPAWTAVLRGLRACLAVAAPDSPACPDPAVYPDGRVCISILHAPGDDPMGYESSAERWSPVQSVEKILLSVVSMLAEPNDESGANVDASKMWRDDREQFYKIAKQIVQKSLGL